MPARPQRLALATILCITVVFSAPAHSAPAGASTVAPGDTIVADVIRLTNVERAQHQQTVLRMDPKLMRAAQLQADQMAAARHMAHVLADAPYPSTRDRLAAEAYRWWAYGENVAVGQTSTTQVLGEWMQSTGHRTNILNAKFTEMGAGYAVDRAGRPYYVQLFAQPQS
jgi:uncharacterized protein YkwD